MKIKIINIDNKTSGDLEVSDKVFSKKAKKDVVLKAVKWQISILKKRTAKTKQRNEIKGSTSKIYAQKGTGGARHSSRKAPIFVGGGIAHGPKGASKRILKINKQEKRLAFKNVLSEKNENKKLFVVDDFVKEIKKTKEFNNFLTKNKLNNLLLVPDKDSKIKVEKSARNIRNLKIIDERKTSIYDLLKYQNVLFTKTAIKNLEKRLLNE
ncbi:MAG: 50S ribosomal protein L4 [Candidatus Pelagibacter sp. TMED64]|nr:50S ribosomal protein L4 [Candidatus Pelagibacter sp.]OUU67077.1 MAG: 50S ribosomal protein L4 [Candidatus Pelagibacter sp. TMED64]|tara:strand:+ start:2445 stop:3074 length:630 start_codon:yes stop_codon:yes gene_type:complete